MILKGQHTQTMTSCTPSCTPDVRNIALSASHLFAGRTLHEQDLSDVWTSAQICPGGTPLHLHEYMLPLGLSSRWRSVVGRGTLIESWSPQPDSPRTTMLREMQTSPQVRHRFGETEAQ